MARAPRRKRLPRQPNHAQQFRAAMNEVEAEDRRRRPTAMQFIDAVRAALGPTAWVIASRSLLEGGRSCVRCGADTEYWDVWLPYPSCLARYGLSPDVATAIIYPVCRTCVGPYHADEIEERILADLADDGFIKAPEA